GGEPAATGAGVCTADQSDRCQDCRNRRACRHETLSPEVHFRVLASVTGSAFGAEMREIAPYKWVHPDDD
ncbi:MAG: hypothetical protein QOG67_1882, partial [Verrucomicrobiota bacterium]